MRQKLSERKYDEQGIESRQSKSPNLYLNTTPIQHTINDINQFYTVNVDIIQSLPRSIQKHTDSVYRSTGTYHLLRNVSYTASQHLRNYNPSTSSYSDRMISITGERGCGKSYVITYLCQLARELDWIVIGTDASEFAWERQGFIQPNNKNHNVFDQPLYTAKWFIELCKNEKSRLQKVCIHQLLLLYDTNE